MLVLLFSLIVQSFKSLSPDYLAHSITMCIRWILYSLLGLRMVYVFKDESADILLIACMVAYMPSILIYFVQNGLLNGFYILFSGEAHSESIVLEIHRMTYIFGFLVVYYLYNWFILNKKFLPQIIFSICLLLLGVKRIASFALIIALIIIVLIKILRTDRWRYNFACVVASFFVLIALGFVFLIKSGYLQLIFEYFGIDDSFRFNFWNYISPKYEFSISFLGNGISYSHRFMWHEWSNIKDLSAATNLHNDVLSYYIGLGFIGFVSFFSMLFIGQMSLLKRWFSTKSALFAFVLSVYYFIIMMTSNEGLPGVVYGCYMMLIFVIASSEDNCFRERAGANE